MASGDGNVLFPGLVSRHMMFYYCFLNHADAFSPYLQVVFYNLRKAPVDRGVTSLRFKATCLDAINFALSF